jgi:hypothetical protein
VEKTYYFGTVSADASLGVLIVCTNAGSPVNPDGAVSFKVLDPTTGVVMATGNLAPLPVPDVGARFGNFTAERSAGFSSGQNYAIIFSYNASGATKTIDGYFTVD